MYSRFIAFDFARTARAGLAVSVCLLLGVGNPLIADENSEETITIPAIPETVDEFVELRNSIAKTPEGGAAVFVVALIKFTEDPGLGEIFLTIALHRSALIKSARGYKGFRPGNSIQYHMTRIKRRPYMVRSYVKGATPENGYELPESDLQIALSRNRYSKRGDDYIKIFVDCSGANSARPVALKENDRGYWKAYEASSLYLDVVPPVTDDGDDL